MLEVIQESIKSLVKSDQKILELLAKNNTITIRELFDKLEMSKFGVKKVIKKLKDEGKLT